MALVSSAAAAVVGSTAAAMYLDARYHLSKDIHAMLGIRRAVKMLQLAEKEKRLSLYFLFEASALRLQNQECIWSRSGCYTWTQTLARAHQYAHWFLSLNVRPGELVAFYLGNSPDFVFAWLGLWAVGAAPAMINCNLAGEALLHCLKISGARLLLVDAEEELRHRVEGVKGRLTEEGLMEMVVLGEEIKGVIGGMGTGRPGDELREGVRGEWPMCLFYTSGTTGMPKGCAFTVSRGYERGVSHSVGLSVSVEGDRWYVCMPLYHGTGGITAIAELMSGITICIGKKFSTRRFWADIRDSRATWFVYVGETARYLLAAPASPLDTVHNLKGMYGNGLRPDIWLKFRQRFNVPEVLEFFSSTEGVLGLGVHARGDFFASCVGHHGALLRRFFQNRLVPVRLDPLTGDIARDPSTGLATREPYNIGGEILVAVSPSSASTSTSTISPTTPTTTTGVAEAATDFPGYFNNPSATAKKFARNVFRKGDIWYRSGDALRRTDDGHWYFLDRLGDTFRWKGENVSTAEVAEVLGRFPAVVEANVYGVALPHHDVGQGVQLSMSTQLDGRGLISRDCLIFLRLVRQMTPIHNNKQNKVPLRAEGVDLDKIAGGEGGGEGDQIFWVPPGGRTYEVFTRECWERVRGGRAML